MPQSRFALPILVLLAITVILGAAGWLVTFKSGDENQARTLLSDAGALVAMNPDGRHIGTVSLATIQDSAKLPNALELTTKLQDVKSLDLNGTAVDNAALKQVGGTSSLVSLSLKSTQIDDAGLAHLAGLTKLESLHLNDTAVSDSGLASLGALRSLKVLDLSATEVTNDLSPLAQLKNLEWLVLGRLTLGDNSLAPLAELPKLKRVTLRGSTYPESAVEQLQASHPGLKVDE